MKLIRPIFFSFEEKDEHNYLPRAIQIPYWVYQLASDTFEVHWFM